MDSWRNRMKKVKGLQILIKYLLRAIILGGIFGNLLCILECLSATPFLSNFGIFILLISSTLTYLIYFLFIQEKKTVYALCIPITMLFMVVGTIDFWGRVFHLDSENMKFIGGATVVLFYMVLYFCIIMVLATLLIRWILIKCERLLDFKKTEEGYWVELRELLFTCDGKDKDYKKSIRALTDAYYQEKEEEIITYMIHQEAFIQVYGEIAENEMLEKIEDMPFIPEIFLHAEMCRTIVFYDETHVIELSFEGIFENLCDIKVRSVYPVDKKQATC